MEVLAPKNALLTTLEKALDEIDKNWRKYNGLIITGSWPGEDDGDFVMRGINRVKEARMNDVPILGICLGHQIIGLAYNQKLTKLKNRRVGLHYVKETGSYETFWHDYSIGRDYLEFGNIIGTQFHPEYQSSKDRPHPILKRFIKLCQS